nr:hypothetical protein [Tanacetum cinerariifolium]
MTRSSTNELFTPFEEPEREFRSSRKHFKTPSLDELRLPDFNLFSDQEYSEEEVAIINSLSHLVFFPCRGVTDWYSESRQVGRGARRTREPMRRNNKTVGELDGKEMTENLLPTLLAQVGSQGSNQGNGKNQNGDAVNDNIQGDCMTRSSTNELFTPFEEPEPEFRSSRKHFKTSSLDDLRLLDLNLFSDQEHSEEEVAETMTKTMEQYMSKTRVDYGSGIARPKIKNKDNFELKGQFVKELLTNTFSSSDHEGANEHIEIVLEIVDLFYIPNITIDQVMLRAFPMSLTGAASCWLRNEPTEMQEVILFYNGLGIPTRQVLNSRGAIPSKTIADAKVAIQEMAEYSHKWHNGTYRGRRVETSDGLAAIQAQLNNLGREIKKVNEKVYASQVGCEQCKGPDYTKYFPLKEEGKTLEEAYYTQSMEDTLSKFMSESAKRHKENSNLIKEIQPSKDVAIQNQGASIKTLDSNRANEQGIGKFVFPIDFIILDMPEDIKVPLILERPFLSIARSKIDVYKRKITLRVWEKRIIFTSVKPASSLIKRVYMLSLRERIELDLEARLIGETLVLNRSLDPFFEDYIELNYLNVPLELRRNQVDDLIPTIEECKVVKEFRTKNDTRMDSKVFGYPSDYDHDKKIHIDYAYNLKFSCMFLTDFVVLEDMDAYHNEEMGDVIFGESFLREVEINVRQFDGIITIYNGNDEVTYQMAQSHPRFKHHTNEQCNKIPPLLK